MHTYLVSVAKLTFLSCAEQDIIWSAAACCRFSILVKYPAKGFTLEIPARFFIQQYSGIIRARGFEKPGAI
jgi:hypothetical protein